MVNVLIIRSRFTDPAIRKVATSLHNHGFDVTLLIWDRSGKRLFSDERTGYKIKYFCLRAPQDKLSAIFFLPLWWAFELLFILKSNPDIIHACDFDTQYPAVIAKILKRKFFVYMIYDFYANNLPNGNFPEIRKIIRVLVANVENLGIGFSDLLILVDESRYEEVKNAKIKKSIYLYNSPENLIQEKSRNLDTDTTIIIFYAGIIQKNRGIDHMIAAVDGIKDVILILAGPLVDQEILVNNVNKNIQYIGWIPTYTELLNKTKNADILFRFSDPNHPKTKYESPNKLFEAMMCGKPIIVSDHSSMSDIVRKENCGIVINFGAINEIREAINLLIHNPDLRNKLGNNSRIAYDNKYSWKIMEKRLVDAYLQLT